MPQRRLVSGPWGHQAAQVAAAGPCRNMTKGHHILQASHPATQAPAGVCGQAVRSTCQCVQDSKQGSEASSLTVDAPVPTEQTHDQHAACCAVLCPSGPTAGDLAHHPPDCGSQDGPPRHGGPADGEGRNHCRPEQGGAGMTTAQ